jgi:hypothetical protein
MRDPDVVALQERALQEREAAVRESLARVRRQIGARDSG